METRSTIAIQNTDGTVKSIYCHWDGYLENNGKILFEHYKDVNKINELISLGFLSSLEKNIHPTTETHSFDNREKDVCVFYGRDRKDTDVEYNTYKNIDEYYQECGFEEFNYLFKVNENKWFVYDSDNYTKQINENNFTELENELRQKNII